MILYFAYLLVFVGKAVKVVRNIASRVHCKGDVATQQTYRRCSFHVIPILCRDDRLEAKKRRKRRVDFVKTKRAKRERERAV